MAYCKNCGKYCSSYTYCYSCYMLKNSYYYKARIIITDRKSIKEEVLIKEEIKNNANEK